MGTKEDEYKAGLREVLLIAADSRRRAKQDYEDLMKTYDDMERRAKELLAKAGPPKHDHLLITSRRSHRDKKLTLSARIVAVSGTTNIAAEVRMLDNERIEEIYSLDGITHHSVAVRFLTEYIRNTPGGICVVVDIDK